jgi:cellobiose PTS system EIIB component
MKKAAETQGVEADIFAISASEIDSVLEKKNVDVLLLGPQVNFMKNQIQSKLAGKNIAVETINMMYYGMMNGEKVLEQAQSLINKN